MISQAQADVILDDWEECTDLGAPLAASASEEFDLDADEQECVADRFRGDLVRDSFSALFASADDDPPAEVINAFVTVLDDCAASGVSGGGVLVDSIAESIAADSDLDEADARCMAQEIVDAIGVERLLEAGGDGRSFDEADPAVQQEFGQAVLSAAGVCDVPLSALSALSALTGSIRPGARCADLRRRPRRPGVGTVA